MFALFEKPMEVNNIILSPEILVFYIWSGASNKLIIYYLPAAKAKKNDSGNSTMSKMHQVLRNNHHSFESLNAMRRSPCHLSFKMSMMIGWSKNYKKTK